MATSAKFSFAHLVEEPDRGPETFALYGPPKIGKTTLLCGIPRLFILCPEEGLKRIERPAPHFPHAPRTLAELYEAFEVFAEGNRGPERPFLHFALDSISWIETMIHNAARAEARTRNLDADYKVGWGNVATLWDELFGRLAALRRRCGVHVWLIAHGEQRSESNAAGETWQKWDLQLERKAAALVRRTVDHVFFLNFASRLQKGGRGRRTVGQYTGRVIYTRDCADHFAGSRSSVPAEIPADARRLLAALGAGAPAPDAKLRGEIEAILPRLPEDERAAFASALAGARAGGDLARILSEAQSVLALHEEDDGEAALEADRAARSGVSTPVTSRAVDEEDGPHDGRDPVPERGASAAADEDDLTKARRILLEANDATTIGKAFIALSKLRLSPEDRSAIAAELRHKKASLSTAAA